jgi:hypothetical protein
MFDQVTDQTLENSLILKTPRKVSTFLNQLISKEYINFHLTKWFIFRKKANVFKRFVKLFKFSNKNIKVNMLKISHEL